ncbi:MAG: hypothetical protein DME87_12200 [Verrucomicrobia bacterium]|nr:MAG: hypothetical protein DME87_12200 [Verrucomicrobiota bacterium]
MSIYCEPNHGTLPAWPCAGIARPAQAPKLCYDVTNVTARADLTIQLRTFFVDWLSNDSRFKISEPNIPIMTFEVCSKLSESTKQTSAIVQLVIEGTPTRLVREWAKLHEEELREAFQLASNFQRPAKIEPLP